MNKSYDKEANANTESDEVDRILSETFPSDMPEELNEKLTASLSSFQQDLEHHPYVRSLEAKRSTSAVKRPRLPLTNARRLAWLAGSAAAIVLIGQWTLSGNAAPTWADVAEQFQSAGSYSAVIYTREDTFADVAQYEFWVNSAGRKRMRAGTQVVFASEAEGLRAFDLVTRQETEPGKKIVGMFQKSQGPLSLETLMRK